MSDHAEQVYRQLYPEEAKLGDVLIPAGWTRIHANVWRKNEGRRVANVIREKSGLVNGVGYLPLLGEAVALLKEAGIIYE